MTLVELTNILSHAVDGIADIHYIVTTSGKQYIINDKKGSPGRYYIEFDNINEIVKFSPVVTRAQGSQSNDSDLYMPYTFIEAIALLT
jgi:hypothetical protein